MLGRQAIEGVIATNPEQLRNCNFGSPGFQAQRHASQRTQKERAMISKLSKCVVAILLVTGMNCLCWSQNSPTKASLKRADVNLLLRSAKTSQDFAALALQFDQRALLFGQKAAEEDAELKRLGGLTYRAKSYPIMVDRAQRCGDYDRAEEKRSSDAAAAFRLRAANSRD